MYSVRLRLWDVRCDAIFDPLRLSTRQRGRRLSQSHVPQPDFVQDLQAPHDLRDGAKEGERLAHRHVEHFIDTTSAILHREHFGLEPLPIAVLAWQKDIGEELHLDPNLAFTLARVAPAAGHVEREVTGLQAVGPRLLRRRKQLPDRIRTPSDT